MLCCLWYSVGLWVRGCGLVCSTSSGFSSGLLFSVGGFCSRVSIVCVCLRARVALAHFGVSTREKKILILCFRAS